MGARNTEAGWGWVAKLLHWTIALAVLGMIAFGFYIDELREAGEADLATIFGLFATHKSVGLTILALMILRLAWRLSGPVPALPEGMPAWERAAAVGTHWLLYLALLAMPVSGYVVHTGFPFNSSFFGLFAIPKLFHADEATRNLASAVHAALAWTVLGLVALHAAAALRHHFFKRDRTLVRMLPFTGR